MEITGKHSQETNIYLILIKATEKAFISEKSIPAKYLIYFLHALGQISLNLPQQLSDSPILKTDIP